MGKTNGSSPLHESSMFGGRFEDHHYVLDGKGDWYLSSQINWDPCRGETHSLSFSTNVGGYALGKVEKSRGKWVCHYKIVGETPEFKKLKEGEPITEEIWSIQRAVGRFRGYPDCCVDAFDNGENAITCKHTEDDFMVQFNEEGLAAIMAEGLGDAICPGFRPCEDCEKKIQGCHESGRRYELKEIIKRKWPLEMEKIIFVKEYKDALSDCFEFIRSNFPAKRWDFYLPKWIVSTRSGSMADYERRFKEGDFDEISQFKYMGGGVWKAK